MPTAPHARGAAEPTLSPDRPGCEGRPRSCVADSPPGVAAAEGGGNAGPHPSEHRTSSRGGHASAVTSGGHERTASEERGLVRVLEAVATLRRGGGVAAGNHMASGGVGPAGVTGLRGDGTSPRGDAPAPAFTFQVTFIRCVMHPGPGQRARGLHGRCGPGPHSRGRPGMAGSDVVTCSLAPLRLPRGGRGLR